MVPVFDGHCDTLLNLEFFKAPSGALKSNKFHVSLERYSGYSPRAQVFAIFGEKGFLPGDVFDTLYGRFMQELELSGDMMSFCKTAEDAEKAQAEGKLAAFLSVEGAGIIDCERGLDAAYEKGVRLINITWNTPNELSGTNAKETERGLSDAGKSFVRHCQRLGVLVDVSHLSDKGFWDLIDITEKPIIASHSNSRAICGHGRNLTDDMFKAIRDCGGTAGINLFTDFLSNPGEKCTVETCIRHIEHFLDMGGEKTVALGGDLDGCQTLPEGFTGIESWEILYNELIARGYSKELADDIFYNNLMRVVRKS